jgi:hypothetical protein
VYAYILMEYNTKRGFGVGSYLVRYCQILLMRSLGDPAAGGLERGARRVKREAGKRGDKGEFTL